MIILKKIIKRSTVGTKEKKCYDTWKRKKEAKATGLLSIHHFPRVSLFYLISSHICLPNSYVTIKTTVTFLVINYMVGASTCFFFFLLPVNNLFLLSLKISVDLIKLWYFYKNICGAIINFRGFRIFVEFKSKKNFLTWFELLLEDSLLLCPFFALSFLLHGDSFLFYLHNLSFV